MPSYAWIFIVLFSITFAYEYEFSPTQPGIQFYTPGDPSDVCETGTTACDYCTDIDTAETEMYCFGIVAKTPGNPLPENASALIIDVDMSPCNGQPIVAEIDLGAEGDWDDSIYSFGDLLQIDYYCTNEIATTNGMPDSFDDVTVVRYYTGADSIGLEDRLLDKEDPSDMILLNERTQKCFALGQACGDDQYTVSVRHKSSTRDEIASLYSLTLSCESTDVLSNTCFTFWREPPALNPWSIYHHGCLRWWGSPYDGRTATISLQTTSFTGSDFDVEIVIAEGVDVTSNGFTWDKIYGVLPSTKSRVKAAFDDGGTEVFYTDEFEVTIPIIEYENPCVSD